MCQQSKESPCEMYTNNNNKNIAWAQKHIYLEKFQRQAKATNDYHY